jgi:hypothetical protein
MTPIESIGGILGCRRDKGLETWSTTPDQRSEGHLEDAQKFLIIVVYEIQKFFSGTISEFVIIDFSILLSFT